MTREAKMLVVGALVLLVGFIVLYAYARQGYSADAPVQPIDFYHYVHARDKEIACEYCHRTAKTAAFAGVPATHFCMRCHRVIIPKFGEIRKLHAYWNRGEAIPWVRVNRLPGFVYFNHRAHTVTGEVLCRECHGPVENMARLRQVTPMNMGWCLDCHRRKEAPTNCWTCHR